MEKEKVVVGIDIGGTNTVFGFVDREGKDPCRGLYRDCSL